MVSKVTRRAALAAAVVLPAAGAAAWFVRRPDAALDGVTDLEWSDLLPLDDPARAVEGVVEHSQISGFFVQPPSTGVRNDWDAQLIRLPGYVVPIEFEGELVTEFILVPYVGACIHVPPPPANQLVYVRTETPFVATGLFDPVRVVGRLDSTETSTRLAQIGYTMQADVVSPFEV